MILKWKFILILSLFTGNVFAQYSPQWLTNTNPLNEHLFNIETHFSESNGLLLAVSGNMSDSLFLASIDSTGNYVWQGNYSFNPSANDKIRSKIYQDDSLNYYFSVLNNFGSHQIKLASNGNVLQIHNDTLLNAIYNLPNYTIIVGKGSNSLYAFKRFTGSQMLVMIKYDLQYNVQWSRILVTAKPDYFLKTKEGTNGEVDVLYSERLTGSPNGHYLNKHITFSEYGDTLFQAEYDTITLSAGPTAIDVYGNVILTKHFPVGSLTGNYDCSVSRYDTAGNLSWRVTLPDSAGVWSSDNVTGVYGDSAGCTYVLSNQNFNLQSVHSGYIFLRKFDPSGNLLWLNSWTGNDPLGTSNGVFCNVLGLTLQVLGDTSVWVMGNVCDMFENANAFVVKLDSSGAVQWQHNYSSPQGLNDNYRFIHQDNCGNIYLAGVTDSLAWSYDAYAKVSKFTIEPGCVNTTGLNSIEIEESATLLIYPNPARSVIQVVSVLQFGTLKMFDTLGNIVYEKKIEAKENFIDCNFLSPGIYHIQLQNDQYNLTEKIIITN